MKKITLLSIMAAMVAALSFTSCNTGDDNSYSLPSLEEQKSMITSLGLMQAGSIVYYNENKLNVKDVLDTIPNTTAYISSATNKDSQGNISNYYGIATYNFPVSTLRNFINDDKLAAKIAEMEPMSIKVNLIPYQYASQTFVANPEDLKLGDITTEDNTYKDVVIKFYNGYCPAGYATNKTTSKQYFSILMQVGAIYVNGNRSSLLKNYTINGTNCLPQFLFTTDK